MSDDAPRPSWLERHGFVVVPILFYLLTCGRTMGLGDVAMMVDRMSRLPFSTDANRHNLAMLLGHVFLWLPVGSATFRANLMAATFGAAANIAFYYLLRRITHYRWTPQVGAALLMVSHSVWWHSTIAENYIVHVFLIICILHLYLSFWLNRSLGALYGAFALSGLAVFNHVQNGVWPVATGVLALMAARRIDRGEFSQPRGFGFLGRLWRRHPVTGGVLGSLLALAVGLAPYLALFFVEVAEKGGMDSAFDSASGGQFKDRMFNFSDTTGVYQSLWYLHLQFPSVLYLFIVAGTMYYLAYGWLMRWREQLTLPKALRVGLPVLVAVCVVLLVFNEIGLSRGEVLSLAGFGLGGNHSGAARRQFAIVAVGALAALVAAHGAGKLKPPRLRPEFLPLQPALWVGAGVTAFFFWFFNTWDQFAFWLPVYVVCGLCGILLMDELLVGLVAWTGRWAAPSRGLAWVLLLLGVATPPWYYAGIGRWSQDPASWWFDGGPYGDNRFINTHNRVAYNYNPNKATWNDMDEVVNLVLDKLPENSTMVDDDSRLFYPINSYYRLYADRPDKGRPDLKLLLINVWGYSHWGTTIDKVVADIEHGKYDEDGHRLFLVACRNYPHRDIIRRLDSSQHWFLPWFLDNTHWVYALHNFDLAKRIEMGGSLPPLNVNYMYLGTHLQQDAERAGLVFSPGEDVMARLVFDRLDKKVKPFTVTYETRREGAGLVSTVSQRIQPDWRASTISLGLPPSVQPGAYEVQAKVLGLVVFQRRFEIRG